MAEVLRVEELSKHFGTVRAVDRISFGIEEGVCFGLLGPNGAGKTTTIEIMEGILAPSSGRVLFRGLPIDRTVKQKVGIQFQTTALPEFITVRETLELFRSFYPNPRSLEEIVELCSLSDILKRDNRKLSGGQRQRMLLGLAIVARPEVVFLDEPTTGLDPQARRNFWELINRIKAEKATVILTTHYMDEAQLLCEEVAIMDHGRILEQGPPERLLARHFDGVLLRVPRNGRSLSASDGIGQVTEREDAWEILSHDLDHTLRSLLSRKIDLEGLSIHKPDLEDLFIKLTGSSLRS